MSGTTWIITVADGNPKKFPKARALVEAGAPARVAARWAAVRREIAPKALKRKAKEARN
jgi:predicted GIY-YIG superfamily endonuclease